MFNFDNDEDFEPMARIKIIGVGDFGMRMINYSIANVLLNVKFAVVATNNETLLHSSAPQRIKLSDTTDEETRKKLFELIKDLDLLFIFTDLTDENISMQIAELSQNILTVTIVPESVPNKDNFQNLVDSLISVDDDNIFLMYSAVRCISNLITEPQLVGLDFADVNELLRNSGRGYVAYGKSSGEADAMNNAINSMKDILRKSKRILFCIIGCLENLSMLEIMSKALDLIHYAAHPDSEIIWSAMADSTITDYVEVIVIASDLEQ